MMKSKVTFGKIIFIGKNDMTEILIYQKTISDKNPKFWSILEVYILPRTPTVASSDIPMMSPKLDSGKTSHIRKTGG